MDTIFSPRQSGDFISKRSKHVYVVKDKIKSASNALLQRILEVKFSKKTWKMHELHPKEMNETAANWIFVVDCLNFSFWVKKEQEPFMVEYKGKLYNDYEALCALINRALEVNHQSWLSYPLCCIISLYDYLLLVSFISISMVYYS